MTPPPSTPLALHAAQIAALCQDIASPEFLRTGRIPRTDALMGAARVAKPTPAALPAGMDELSEAMHGGAA